MTRRQSSPFSTPPFIAHIGYVIDGQPFVTPTAFWRQGRTLYWHGSAASSRMLRFHLVVEAHLVDFSADLYDASVRLSFHARLRGEQRFESVQALVARIQQDVRAARELLPPPAGRGV